MNGRAEIEVLARLADEAFAGPSSYTLLANLESVRVEDWDRPPVGGGRTIGDIAEHAGWCKWMYEDYAFGAGSLAGDRPPLVPAHGARSRPTAELLAWMRAGHARWVASIRALPDDGELDRLRPANWGDLLPTRRLIEILVHHDVYHAGEINHLRALLQGTDRWEYE